MNWLALVPYAIALAIGAGGAWPLAASRASAPLQAQINTLREDNAAMREDNAEALRLATKAVAQRLQQAQAASQSASQRLAIALAKNDQLTKEKTHALKTATSGRACLSERAVRLLNGEQAAPAGAAPGADLPAAPGQPDAAGARAASDSDVAVWIAGAQQRYEACRAQVAELIRWHADQQPTAPTAPTNGAQP